MKPNFDWNIDYWTFGLWETDLCPLSRGYM